MKPLLPCIFIFSIISIYMMEKRKNGQRVGRHYLIILIIVSPIILFFNFAYHAWDTRDLEENTRKIVDSFVPRFSDSSKIWGKLKDIEPDFVFMGHPPQHFI